MPDTTKTTKARETAARGSTELTPKQRRFVAEYVVDCNGTQAAIRAGYSPRTANEQAAQLLAKLSVQNAVREAQARVAEAVELTAADVIRGLWIEAQRTDEGSSHSARVAAYGLLAKHFGLLVERQESTVRHVFVDPGEARTSEEWASKWADRHSSETN